MGRLIDRRLLGEDIRARGRRGILEIDQDDVPVSAVAKV
jgi:hypothetical protein